VFNILNCLLNYCNFVRYVYTETIHDAKVKLAELQEKQSLKNQLRAEIEQAKIREENNEKSNKDFDTKIPRQRAINEDLEKKEKRLREDLVKLQADSEKSDLNLIEKNNELMELMEKAVSDQEIDSIVAVKESVKKQLEEQEQITIAGRQKIKENSRAIEHDQEITMKMETLLASISIDDGEMVARKKKVAALKVEVEALKATIAKLKHEIEATTQSLDTKTKTLSHVTTKLEEVKKSYIAKESEQRREIKDKENLLRKVVAQEAALASAKERLQAEIQYNFQVARNVIKHMSSPAFDEELRQL
jgi:chromosome segregation ATPase